VAYLFDVIFLKFMFEHVEGSRVVCFTRCLLLLSTMVDERPQTAKESSGIGKHLKKLFRFGSQSAPHSRSSSPQPSASTLLVSSGVQLINPGPSTRQQDCILTDKILSLTYRSSHTNPVVANAVIAI